MNSEILENNIITNNNKRAFIPFILLSIFLIGITAGLGEFLTLMSSKSDWNNIRCTPHVMPFAFLYGYDMNENFNYCMGQSFKSNAGEYLGPIYQFMGGFVGVLGTLVSSANSLRVGFATFLGGFNVILQEFTDRIKQFFIQVKRSTQRIKMLMQRIYANFFAIIYMGTSGVKAAQNFGGTALFAFLDTFCFDPDTLIDISGKGLTILRDVQLGDIITGGSKIVSKFNFMADGQQMVILDNIIVSTNHYVLYKDKWIRADKHPDAQMMAEWCGGNENPLICFNTEDHCIKIGKYTFRDYDETEEGDSKTEKFIEKSLNGCELSTAATCCSSKKPERSWQQMRPAISPQTAVKLSSNAVKTAKDIQLGDILSTNDTVIGVIDTYIYEIVDLDENHSVSASTLFWNSKYQRWDRAGDVYQVRKMTTPVIYRGFVVLPGSKMELSNGLFIRDYMEIASPFVEEEYTKCLNKMNN